MAHIENTETMTDKLQPSDPLGRGGRLYEEQLRAKIFEQRVRRDAKKALEEEDRMAAHTDFDGAAKLVYEALPEDSPELIPGLLPESGTAAIVGETDCGKSLCACEIGSSLLTGQPLWGALQPNRTIEKVVYVLGEHTVSTLQGLFHRTKLPHEGKFHVIGPENLHPFKALVVSGVQQAVAVEKMLRWTDGAGLIVFDPLAGFVQGQNAENDNSVMRTLVDTLNFISEKQAAACLVLAHTGKPRMDESGNEFKRTSYATRGSSAIEDSMTHIFYLRRPMIVKQMKQDSYERYELSVRKFKGNPTNQVFKLIRDPETKRNTLVEVRAANVPSLEEKLALNAEVMQLQQKNPGFSTSQCIKLVADTKGMPKETLERWLTMA